MNKLQELYNSFLEGNLDYQKELGIIKLNKLNIISGVTCIGKSTFIEKNNLATITPYKTSYKDILERNRQIIISPEKFCNHIENGDFFDVYSIDEKFYGYKIEDYFIVAKEFENIYADISIETIFRKNLKYEVKKIYILDYNKNTLEKNIKKRIETRKYDSKRIKHLHNIINKELEMLKIIKNNYKEFGNIYFIKENEIKNIF